MRCPLWKEGEGAAAGEETPRGFEGLPILGDVTGRILTPINGDRVEGSDEEPDDGHLKERRLGEEGDAAGRKAEQKQRIDERVGMIDREDHPAFPRDAFGSLQLDTSEENP